ncbi:MAG TPA: hypothetical protein VN934_01255 [Candidatus Tumulicola sp.]|nr:hypothetical protein [Candidatus Tumulicola sp.]
MRRAAAMLALAGALVAGQLHERRIASAQTAGAQQFITCVNDALPSQQRELLRGMSQGLQDVAYQRAVSACLDQQPNLGVGRGDPRVLGVARCLERSFNIECFQIALASPPPTATPTPAPKPTPTPTPSPSPTPTPTPSPSPTPRPSPAPATTPPGSVKPHSASSAPRRTAGPQPTLLPPVPAPSPSSAPVVDAGAAYIGLGCAFLAGVLFGAGLVARREDARRRAKRRIAIEVDLEAK